MWTSVWITYLFPARIRVCASLRYANWTVSWQGLNHQPAKWAAAEKTGCLWSAGNRERGFRRNYRICLGVCELFVVVSVEWTLRRCLHVDMLSGETVSAKCQFIFHQRKPSHDLAGWHCIFGITQRGLKELYEPKGAKKLTQLREEQVILQLISKRKNCRNRGCEVFTQQGDAELQLKPKLGHVLSAHSHWLLHTFIFSHLKNYKCNTHHSTVCGLFEIVFIADTLYAVLNL